MPESGPPQNPVPIDAAAVLAWYDVHARKLPWRLTPQERARGSKADPYRLWLSEVMLQQTTVAAARAYYLRFTTRWPTVADLAASPLEAVLVEWAGLGYYARARNLHACAIAVVDRFGGRFPATAAQLLTLPGIGPYTSAAISAIAEDQQIAVVDGNVERVMARYLALEVPPRDAKALIRSTVQGSVPERAGDYAQALMDLGATICTPRAAMCLLCPLAAGCRAVERGPLRYPAKVQKPVRPTRYGHAFVLRDADGDVYLVKRPRTGVLAQMTGTPTSQWSGERHEVEFPVVADWYRHGPVVHVFTHFRLELDIWSARIGDAASLTQGWWADPAQLRGEALPSLFRRVLESAGLSEEKPPAQPVPAAGSAE